MGETIGKNVLFRKLARDLHEKVLHLGIEVKKRATHCIVPSAEEGEGLIAGSLGTRLGG